MTDPAQTKAPLRGDAALVRALGPFQLGASIINIIVGAGIFMLPALLAARLGPVAPLAFVAGAMAIVPIALCFAAVGSRAVATGGPYTYVGAGFGPFAGFLTGALMWICNVTSSAGVAAALAMQLAQAFPVLSQPAPRAILIVAVYSALFALNAFGVKLGARMIVGLAALKLTPLFLLASVGLFFIDWTQVSFDWRAVPSWEAFGSSLVLVVFAYAGMETALVPSGEVRDPSRHVPRATLSAIVIVVLLYIGIQAACQGTLGAELARSATPVADAADTLWMPARALLLATAGVSMLGFLMGNLFSSSRLLFALGRDGFLPRAFGVVDARHRVPMLALCAHAAIAIALAVVGTFETMALISGGAICLVFAAVAAAAWRTQRMDLRGQGEPLVLPGGGLVPALAMLTMAAILATLSAQEWLAIAVSLTALVMIYAVLAALRGRSARTSRI